jgi:3-deoxy-D-manno-octulosonic-acid transferase
MRVIYNIGIFIFNALAHLVSPINAKVALWTNGQKNWAIKIRGKINPAERNIWIHCASLGEFEQGRPLIEALKKERPEYKVILTFFSPSGYEIRKNYLSVDCVSYLPVDKPRNAEKFIELVNPEFVIFVKYEFWNNYISVLYRRNIPLYLVSAIFRQEQHFFRWYGAFFRSMLKKFRLIFVQDQQSASLLKQISIDNILVAGDTRFDRVIRIASAAKTISQLEKFRGDEKLFLAGSSWSQDEEIISRYINMFPDKMKWVFAPHEIDEPNIERLVNLFTVKCIRFSEFNENVSDARVLIIDNIGMLSSAYRYAHIAEIGGGFGKGIHNILEPASWGIPVVFGPKYKMFREANDLKAMGGAESFQNYDDFENIINRWLDNSNLYTLSAEAAGNYVKSNTGATEIIIKEILHKDINKTY